MRAKDFGQFLNENRNEKKEIILGRERNKFEYNNFIKYYRGKVWKEHGINLPESSMSVYGTRVPAVGYYFYMFGENDLFKVGDEVYIRYEGSRRRVDADLLAIRWVTPLKDFMDHMHDEHGRLEVLPPDLKKKRGRFVPKHAFRMYTIKEVITL